MWYEYTNTSIYIPFTFKCDVVNNNTVLSVIYFIYVILCWILLCQRTIHCKQNHCTMKYKVAQIEKKCNKNKCSTLMLSLQMQFSILYSFDVSCCTTYIITQYVLCEKNIKAELCHWVSDFLPQLTNKRRKSIKVQSFPSYACESIASGSMHTRYCEAPYDQYFWQ